MACCWNCSGSRWSEFEEHLNGKLSFVIKTYGDQGPSRKGRLWLNVTFRRNYENAVVFFCSHVFNLWLWLALQGHHTDWMGFLLGSQSYERHRWFLNDWNKNSVIRLHIFLHARGSNEMLINQRQNSLNDSPSPSVCDWALFLPWADKWKHEWV